MHLYKVERITEKAVRASVEADFGSIEMWLPKKALHAFFPKSLGTPDTYGNTIGGTLEQKADIEVALEALTHRDDEFWNEDCVDSLGNVPVVKVKFWFEREVHKAMER